MKHNKFITEVKSFSDEDRTILMCGSTANSDRVGDKIELNGVDLKNFKKNPIILFNHDYDKVVGKAQEVYIKDEKLLFKIQFADTELGTEVFYLLKNGYLNASSVGFIGKEYKPNGEGLTFTSIELLELSIVSVPCNPEAIIQLRKAVEQKTISKDMFINLGGIDEVSEKAGAKFSKKNLDTIKEAIKLLNSLIEEPEDEEEEQEAEEDKPEEEKKNVEEQEEEPEKPEEEKKEYTNEELFREIMQAIKGGI